MRWCCVGGFLSDGGGRAASRYFFLFLFFPFFSVVASTAMLKLRSEWLWGKKKKADLGFSCFKDDGEESVLSADLNHGARGAPRPADP